MFTSNVNMNKPTETIAFRDSGKVTSLSVWGKFVALGSDKIHLMDMDHNKTKLLYTREIEHNQVYWDDDITISNNIHLVYSLLVTMKLYYT